MDVPEASKHGKKSTSQKLEDQKKVGNNFAVFIFFLKICISYLPLLCVRAVFQKKSLLAFAVFQLYVCGSQGMEACLLAGLFFYSQKGEHSGPIAAVV